MQRGLLTGMAFGMAMVIFALQNSVKVPVKFLWMKFAEVPLALILVIVILVVVLITALFSYVDKQKLKSRIKKLQVRLREYEQEEDGHRDSENLISENGLLIEGEPGHKFFDD